MIHHLQNLPTNIVGFKSTRKITKNNFTKIAMPKVKALSNKTYKLNYLLVLNTPINNFTIGAWIKDALMEKNI